MDLTDTSRPWWRSMTPEVYIPRTSAEGARVIPARYHGDGYHTNEPTLPLWKELRTALKGHCRPLLYLQRTTWCLDYAVIEDLELATRVAKLLMRHPLASRRRMIAASRLMV